MKPVYAQCIIKYDLHSKDERKYERDYFLRFEVTFDDTSKAMLYIQTDRDYTRPLAVKLSSDEAYQPVVKNSWQDELFQTWKINCDSHGDKDIREYGYHYSANSFGHETWAVAKTVEKDLSEDLSEESTFCFDGIREFLNDSYESVVRFFSSNDPEIVPYTFEESKNSCFGQEQINSIVKLINDLEKEVNSRWHPNKERKAVKIDGLKTLLTESLKEDRSPSEAVDLIKKLYDSRGFSDGLTSRTADLMQELCKPSKYELIS
jgi:hypothetical protein